ncbi:MAG: hypothetical protein WBI44_00945 [Syntrophaceticus sp.]
MNPYMFWIRELDVQPELKKIHQKWQTPFILVTYDEDDVAVLGDTKISLFSKSAAAG